MRVGPPPIRKPERRNGTSTSRRKWCYPHIRWQEAAMRPSPSHRCGDNWQAQPRVTAFFRMSGALLRSVTLAFLPFEPLHVYSAAVAKSPAVLSKQFSIILGICNYYSPGRAFRELPWRKPKRKSAFREKWHTAQQLYLLTNIHSAIKINVHKFDYSCFDCGPD